MAQARRRRGTSQEVAATNSRNFRTFLLMQQFAAAEIGARIVQARKERGMIQEDLADLVSGFSKRSLQDYEAGKTIPYRHLKELSRLLGKPEEWFLYGDQEPEVPSDERLREIIREELQDVLSALQRIEHAGGARPEVEEEQSG